MRQRLFNLRSADMALIALYKKLPPKKLPNSLKTRLYLDSLPKVYLIAHWAHWGIMSFPFSGKFKTDSNGKPIPLVYSYYDGNGICDEFHLIPITATTSAEIGYWSFNPQFAREIVANFTLKEEEISYVMDG